MELAELRKNWNAYGETDPYWAVLTDPRKRGGRWDIDEFFRSGEEEIAKILVLVRSLPHDPPSGRALDFGCGVGRLTQALGDHFDSVVGVDIAASMVERAVTHNRHGERCRYVVNSRDDLRLFDDDSFDFIYTARVLQHIRPAHIRSYLREFIRVLAPGGLIVFLLPDGPVATRLPDGAFRARIEVVRPPANLPAGSSSTLVTRVTNLSEIPWPALGVAEGEALKIKIGNHWIDERGATVAFDDGRAVLPMELKPGESVEIPLAVSAPQAPGLYTLELDMVQEGVSWFNDKGSDSARLAMRVSPGRASHGLLKGPHLKVQARPVDERPAQAEEAALPEFQPVMEMHGIPSASVAEFLRQEGGDLVDLHSWMSDGWLHSRYCVAKGRHKG